MTIDVNALTNEYNRLATLSQSDQQAAANGACAAYAQNMPAILDELRLTAGGGNAERVATAYQLLSDIESELTYELEKINRRDQVSAFLQNVRDNT